MSRIELKRVEQRRGAIRSLPKEALRCAEVSRVERVIR